MIQKHVLNNGIRVITERIPSIHSVALGVWIQHGSRHEPPELSGCSHFIEHMLFKGTTTRSTHDIACQIDAVGGMLNAFTSREHSCYYAKILCDSLPLAVELLSDLLLNSTFDPDELEKERRVILQEISMLHDSPEELVHEMVCQGLWEGNALSRPVLGTQDSVANVSREQMIKFMHDHYCGRRIIICAAGNVDHREMRELVEEAFGSLGAGEPLPEQSSPEIHCGVDIETRDLEQVHMCLAAPGLPQADPNRYPLYLFNTVLGSSMSSRLFQNVREERGLAYSIYSYLNGFTDCGSQVVYAGVAPTDVHESIDLILRELRQLCRTPVHQDELTAACNQLKGNLLLSLENSDNRMSRLAKDEIYFGRCIPIEDVIENIDSVTPEQIVEVGSRLMHGKDFHLQLIGNVGEGELGTVDLCFDHPC